MSSIHVGYYPPYLKHNFAKFCSHCCCYSVTQLCPTPWDSMDYSTPGFPVLHYFPDPAQTHVHWVSDVIQSSCPLSSPSPPVFNLSQHQSLLQWVNSSPSEGQIIGALASASSLASSVLPMNIQGWFPLGLTGLISLQSKWLLRAFSNTTIQKHPYFSTQPSLWLNSHIHTWKNHSFDYAELCRQSDVSAF